MRRDLPALSLVNVSKAFNVYPRPADILWEHLTARRRGIEKWALRDIILDVQPGEVVGVIGRNGAGKSTLLRVIAGTLSPTAGEISRNGRVAAILELGTGFREDYTGAENVVLGGLCLGMSRREVESKRDQIVAFSELGSAIDHPIRTYSTGMRMRLGFSTSIFLSADIFIIDEALAVGDTLFQAKCMDKLKEIKDSGATVFFVSHGMGAVYELCTRAILLDRGRMVMDGTPRAVGATYDAYLQKIKNLVGSADDSELPAVTLSDGTPPDPACTTDDSSLPQAEVPTDAEERWIVPGPPPTERPRINLTSRDAPASTREPPANLPAHAVGYVERVTVLDSTGTPVGTLSIGDYYQVRVQARLLHDTDRAVLGYFIELPTGMVLFGNNTYNHRITQSGSAGQILEARFTFRNRLGVGSYLVGGAFAHVSDDRSVLNHSHRGAAEIVVQGDHSFEGAIDLTETIAVRSL